jgi:hypothetical protein
MVLMRASAKSTSFTVGFGEVSGTVLPAVDLS